MNEKSETCIETASRVLNDIDSMEKLWNAIIDFQNYQFYTATGLAFSYTIKVGRDGTYNKE